MVIATAVDAARSPRWRRSSPRRSRRELGRTPRIEGLPAADWVLIDAGDVIVHLFRPEVRSFYNLERMWAFGDAPRRGLAADPPAAPRRRLTAAGIAAPHRRARADRARARGRTGRSLSEAVGWPTQGHRTARHRRQDARARARHTRIVMLDETGETLARATLRDRSALARRRGARGALPDRRGGRLRRRERAAGRPAAARSAARPGRT